ncbi:thiol-disulfide oxidoreductase DCC family protein [Cellvibrio sp.]
MPLPQPTNRAQLYYDGRCPLCAREMAFLRKFKQAGLTLVDIHQLLQLTDEEQEQMLRNLHLQMPDGSSRFGVEANVIAWSFTPMGFLWKPLRWKIWAALVDKIYQRWADRRYCRSYACAVTQGVKP